MDDAEFRRLLDLFPIVRSRDYRAESEQCRESTSKSAQHEEHKEWQDAWDEGDKIEVEKQGLDEHAEAERFCKAFQRIHKKLVYEELSLDAAQKFLNSA
ncbi:unnamed protein product [Malus baccata var. baccata]